MRTVNIRLNVRPWLPTQAKYLEAREKYIGYVGGVGCGKTVITLANGILLNLEYPGNRGVIDSPTFPKLKDDVVPVLREIIPPDLLDGGSWKSAWHGTDHNLRFANGSVINCRSPDHPDKIRGPTIGWFAMTEAGMRPMEYFDAYRGRLRRSGVRLCGMVDSNPESQAHWMHKKFVEKSDEDSINTYRLFQASSYENIYNPDGYIQDLEKFSGEWREKFLLGRWTGFSGQIYGNIDPEIHYVEPRDFYRRIWDDAKEFWNFGNGIDPAESQPTAAWWKFHDEQGRSWYVDRYSKEGKVTSEHCKAIEAKGREWGREPEETDMVMDPSAGAKRVEGISLQSIYNSCGLYPRLALSCRRNDSVIWGIGQVRNRLHPDPTKLHPITGLPGCPQILFVLTDGVREGLQYITSYRWSSHTASSYSGKDRPHKYQDHDPDAVRYRECEEMETPEDPELAAAAMEAEYERQQNVDPNTGFQQK